MRRPTFLFIADAAQSTVGCNSNENMLGIPTRTRTCTSKSYVGFLLLFQSGAMVSPLSLCSGVSLYSFIFDDL